MQPDVCNFTDELKKSKVKFGRVKQFLLHYFYGALDVTVACLKNDLAGVDYWVVMPRGIRVGVDVKTVETDYLYWDRGPSFDHLPLEIWSKKEQGHLGWTRDPSKKCDYVCWLWLSSGRLYIVPHKMVLEIFLEHFDEWAGSPVTEADPVMPDGTQNWTGKYRVRRQWTNPEGRCAGWHSYWVSVPRRLVHKLIDRKFHHYCGGYDGGGRDTLCA